MVKREEEEHWHKMPNSRPVFPSTRGTQVSKFRFIRLVESLPLENNIRDRAVK